MFSARFYRSWRRGLGIRFAEQFIDGLGKAYRLFVDDLKKPPPSIAIINGITEQNFGKRANTGQWCAYLMIQDRNDFVVELQRKQQSTTGHTGKAMTRGKRLGGFILIFIEATLAQFLIFGTVLVVRGAMPDDNFHMIGRNVASSHVAVVHALPVIWTNPLAIYVRSKSLLFRLRQTRGKPCASGFD